MSAISQSGSLKASFLLATQGALYGVFNVADKEIHKYEIIIFYDLTCNKFDSDGQLIIMLVYIYCVLDFAILNLAVCTE